jgi:hypothetical protein
VYVDAVVFVEQDDAMPRETLKPMLTLEVYDVATGKTVFTMPFAEVGGIDPTPF